MNQASQPADWRAALPEGLRPYAERAPIAALFLGISSGFPYAMIGATLTSRLAQDGIDKKSVTAFSLAFLVYNLKFLWAPLVDGVRLPLLGRLGQRVSWMLLAGSCVIAAVLFLGAVDPRADLRTVALAAVLVGVAGATFDIVIDAYRIETLAPHQLGVGSGMSQYGWRIGSVAAGALALVLAARVGWRPIGPAPPSLCRRCSPQCSSASRRVIASRAGGGGRGSWPRPSSGRSPNSSGGRARGSCCCSCCSTRSATR